MLEHNDNYEQVKGILGVLLASIPQFFEYLPGAFKILSGIGGVVLISLSIRSKILDIKIKKEKLKDERGNT